MKAIVECIGVCYKSNPLILEREREREREFIQFAMESGNDIFIALNCCIIQIPDEAKEKIR